MTERISGQKSITRSQPSCSTLTAFKNTYARLYENLLLCSPPTSLMIKFSNILLGPEKLISGLSNQILELGAGLGIYLVTSSVC